MNLKKLVPANTIVTFADPQSNFTANKHRDSGVLELVRRSLVTQESKIDDTDPAQEKCAAKQKIKNSGAGSIYLLYSERDPQQKRIQ